MTGTAEEEYGFYARPENQVPQGKPQRRKPTQAEAPDENDSTLADIVGPIYVLEDVARIMGMSEEKVKQGAEAGEFLSLLTSDDCLVFPEWQFHDGKVRSGVADAVRIFKTTGMDGWMHALWFEGDSPALDGMSAKDWLLSGGDPEKVRIQAARTSFGWRS